MRKLIVLLFVLASLPLLAQPIEDLRAPASPAFVLLGVEPSSVERPVSPKALTFNLLNAVKDGSGFPSDYALEVSPYWMRSHPELTFDSYYKASAFGATPLQTLSISLATSTTEDDADDSSDGGLALGVRTLLVRGRGSKKLLDLKGEIDKVHVELLLAEGRGKTQAEIAEMEKGRLALSLAIQDEGRTRVGWNVELAAGASTLLEDRDWDKAETQRWGAWLTPSYTPEGSRSTFLGVARLMHEESNSSDLVDVGARYLWAASRAEISAEYVRRMQSEGDDTYRAAIVASYDLSREMILTASYGKNYETADSEEDLLAIFGIRFSLARASGK